VSKNFAVLGDLLMGFYDFLDRKPKPTDDEVRREFVRREQCWKRYCKGNGLTAEAAMMFNSEVAATWNKRYVQNEKEDNQ
jgi:hypothetical protein